MRGSKVVVAVGAAAALMAGTAAALSSCVLPDFEVGATGVDAGHDAAVDAPAEAAAPGCGKTYPDPPSGGDMPVSNTVVLALHAVDLGEGETTPPGYDLDHQCTCFEDAGPTCVSSNQHCDAVGGIDNGAAPLINLVSIAIGGSNFGSSYFSTKADEGHWSLLIQMSGYNGLADDPEVDVALFPSGGLMGATPGWDGNDAWPVVASSVTGGDLTKPVYTSKGAYVAGNVLVAAMPTVALTISGGVDTITFTLSDGVLTGTLAPLGGGYRITDGVMAARWYQPDIFAAFSSYRDDNGTPLCTDNLAWNTAKGAICGGLDILKDLGGPKSLPCDSLSMGIGFRADPAKVGAVSAPVQLTAGCPATTDPKNQSCSP